MAPKRKRAEEGTAGEGSESLTAPRRSNRNKSSAAEPAPAKTEKKTTKAAVMDTVAEGEPAPKRKKATKAEATDKPAAKRGRKKAGSSDAEPTPSVSKVPAAKPSVQTTETAAATGPAIPPPTKSKSTKLEPYTPKRAQDLFNQYADSDDPSVIGPEGFERLFADAEIPMDGALPLLLAWQMEAKEMAKITKEEWVKGTANLKIASLGALSIALDDLEKLLVSAHSPLKRSAKPEQDPYDRTLYFQYASDVKSNFSKFYTYCFSLAKPEGSRNIDMETSAAFWTVLLAEKYPIMREVVQFIGDKKDVYRATNKDLWSMMLEFCQTVNPTLEDYEADGAWPTLLDDFAQWKTTNKGANPNGI